MRLDKLLTLLGEGARSEIKAAVRAGRVTVNGASVRDAGMQVEGETDDIRLDGRRLSYKPVRHVMLHKPAGVLTAARDRKQKTVMDLLPPMYAAMGAMPAGRLDKDTEDCSSHIGRTTPHYFAQSTRSARSIMRGSTAS